MRRNSIYEGILYRVYILDSTIFFFAFFSSFGGLVNTIVKFTNFHVQNACRVSIEPVAPIAAAEQAVAGYTSGA